MAIFKKTQKDIRAELATSRQELADKQAKMSAAVIAGGDIDKLTGDVARVKARIAALETALPAAAVEDMEAAEQRRQVARDAWQQYLSVLERDNAELLKDVYKLNERAEKLVTEYKTSLVLAERGGLSVLSGSNYIGLAVATVRSTAEIKLRVGMGNPEFALRHGFKPYKGG